MVKISQKSNISQGKPFKKGIKGRKCKTAPKYNGGQNYTTTEKHTKSTISIDWFEATLSIAPDIFSSCLIFSSEPPETVEIGDYSFVKRPMGTKFYKHFFDVYYHGELFGTLCTVPRSEEILDINSCIFKYSNHKLYQCDFITEFNEFMSVLGAMVKSYTRIDLALDGFGFIDFYGGFMKGKYDRIGRTKYKNHFEKIKKVDRVLTGIDWGSKASDKYMTIYRKGSRVMNENKSYIVKFWENSGLIDEGGDFDMVERMELKMKAKAINQLVDFHHDKLTDVEYMASCLRTHFKKWYEFVTPGGGNVSRRERVHFIDWESIGGRLLEKDTTKPSNEVWSAKITIKTVHRWMKFEAVNAVHAHGLIQTALKIYDLQRWFDKVEPTWKHKPIVSHKEYKELIVKDFLKQFNNDFTPSDNTPAPDLFENKCEQKAMRKIAAEMMAMDDSDLPVFDNVGFMEH